jgi:hypothetical protein
MAIDSNCAKPLILNFLNLNLKINKFKIRFLGFKWGCSTNAGHALETLKVCEEWNITG